MGFVDSFRLVRVLGVEVIVLSVCVCVRESWRVSFRLTFGLTVCGICLLY